MCLLCVFQPGASPTRQELENSAASNPHGFGYAFLMHDRIITGRGMDATDVIDRFMRLREGYPDVWAMFHARYATHGVTDKSNCHPFRVDGDPNIVLAHNGILPIDVPRGENRSDTRIFADDHLPNYLEWLDDPTGFQLLEDWASGSKVAIFSLDKRLENNVYIINENLGHWDNGRWWSNSSYKTTPYIGHYSSKSMRAYGGWLDEEWVSDNRTDSCGTATMTEWWKRSGEESCVYCSNPLSSQEWDWGYCDFCKSCLECAMDIVDCECYRQNMPDHNSIHTYRQPMWWEVTEHEKVGG